MNEIEAFFVVPPPALNQNVLADVQNHYVETMTGSSTFSLLFLIFGALGVAALLVSHSYVKARTTTRTKEESLPFAFTALGVHGKRKDGNVSATRLNFGPLKGLLPDSMRPSNPMRKPKIADSIVDVIGATPMVRVNKLSKGLYANIICKLESMEPCNSVKDRIGKSMIEEAEARGDIVPGKTTLIEPTSGNTGIALAMVAAAKGYDLILTMPESMSMERRVLFKALGAKLVLTPAAKGMGGAVGKAEAILAATPNGFMLQQFNNKDNPKVHRETTGPEIWYQTDGNIDILMGGVGTGGTITGCTQFLRNKKEDLKVIAIEPTESPVLSGGQGGPHKIQGIGAGFIPDNCDTSLLDQIIQVSSADAIDIAKKMATEEGLLVGISSGAVMKAALDEASKPENAGKNIVVVIPSFGERYLSTALFADLFEEARNQEAEPL